MDYCEYYTCNKDCDFFMCKDDYDKIFKDEYKNIKVAQTESDNDEGYKFKLENNFKAL